MKNKIIFSSIIISCSMLANCATIISGTSQTLNVQAVDAKTHQSLTDVQCTIQNAQGDDFNVLANPGEISLPRAKGPLKVNCIKKGYQQAQIGVGTSFNGWTIVNLLFWPGFILDGISGAYSSYQPTHVTVLMTKEGNDYVPVKSGSVEKR